MKLNFLAATALVAVLAVPAANARDLWVAGIGENSVAMFDVDTRKSISKSVVEIWEDDYLRGPNGRAYLRFRSQVQMNCSARETRTLYIVGYRPDGSVEGSERSSKQWNPVPPGTVAEGSLDFVCASPSQRTRYGMRINPDDAEAWADKVINE